MQREDYKQWCWELSRRTGTKQAWARRYKETWLRYLDSIGLERMLTAIKDRAFANVEYLLRQPSDEREIGLLEELELRVKIKSWEKDKAGETVSPVIVAALEKVQSQPLGGPTDDEIRRALEAMTAPRTEA